MHDDQSTTIQQVIGQIRSLFYLVDEPITTLTIQTNGQRIAARASGQVALGLRTLRRGVTICATLHESPDTLQIIAFIVRMP